MGILQSHKQYLKPSVRLGSIKNVLETQISLAQRTKQADLIGEDGTPSPFPEAN